jgi:hypothetical protein
MFMRQMRKFDEAFLVEWILCVCVCVCVCIYIYIYIYSTVIILK